MANPRAVRFLKDLVKQFRPSLVFLSEIFVNKSRVESVCKKLGFSSCWVVETNHHGGGVALLWKESSSVEIKGSCENYIDVEVYVEQVGRWRYTGFYGYPERQRRHESWNLLRGLAQNSSLPWCVLGDFNDLMYAEEKRGGRAHPKRLLEGFCDVIEECNLQELDFTGSLFTWERGRGTPNWIQERLDRGLVNKEWHHLFPDAELKVLDVSTSDHRPLVLQLNRQIYVPRSKRFKFENLWLRERDCVAIVETSWNEIPDTDIMARVNNCGAKLEEWGGGIVKEFKQRLQKTRNELRIFGSRRDAYAVRKYNAARQEFHELLKRQEIYWQQRAKQFWLTEGDQNSRFFHNYASSRRRNNNVNRLKDKNGLWREDSKDVQQIVSDYFGDLFKASGNAATLTERESVPRVTEEINESLLEPVDLDETKNAVFSMHSDKAPGLDGLNPTFYQSFWGIVGADVTRFCNRFIMEGFLPEGVNHTLVCLIPKVKHPEHVTDMRPISLCNVLIRILSKVLANRLKPCLKSLISDKQSAFVEGRLLTDNTLVAFEINHYIKRKTQGKKGVAALKLDISKAYDRLEWNFLEHMLRKFGFSEVWVDRILRCINSVSYSFIQNGEVFGHITPSRGLRQGDPISPYLYIMCVEGLSSMIRRNETVGLIHGCSIARGAPAISHLLFADDCYLFIRAKEVEATTMKSILLRYEHMSGQAINCNKSTICFSPNTSIMDRQEVCQKLGIREVHDPGKYLGMPMRIGRKKHEVFQFIKDRIKQKLHGWKNKSISKPGKITLLKSAAQSIPNFWMSLFLIPTEVCDDLEKLMNSYWWCNGAACNQGIKWMSWKRLCAVKEAGGLGFKDLSHFNISMLAKQGWRLINNDNPLVTSLMQARYYPSGDFLNATLGTNPSFMWRSILAAQNLLKQGCRKRIGDGESTRIWQVPWLPDSQNGFLSSEMPNQLSEAKVSGLMDMEGGKWDDEIIRDICNDRDRELINSILLPKNGRGDDWYWLFEANGAFSVRSGYRKLQGEHPKPHAKFWKKMWNLQLPGKVVNLVWRACSACLPTAVALASKRVPIQRICPWCHQKEETDIHMLFDCNFARSIWSIFDLQDYITVGIGEVVLDILIRIFDALPMEKCALIGLGCWCIWNRRNTWVWDKINKSVYGTKTEATNMLRDWKNAQEGHHKGGQRTQSTGTTQWSKPATGWIKINTDAALFEDIKRTGFGCIARGDRGEFLMARAEIYKSYLTPREAEVLSLKEAIHWAVRNGVKRCIFETDAKLVVDAIHGSLGRTPFHLIANDCVNLLKHFEDVLVCYVNRSANGVAHLLAKANRSMSDCIQEWHLNAPDFISDVILAEAL